MKKIFTLSFILCLTIGSVSAQFFVEKSQEIGIDHAYLARGLTGGGAAFFDYDNDGDEDLYITTGTIKQDFIYANNGDGTFTKVLDDLGLRITRGYNTVAVTTGDIDNDGDRDLFVTTWEYYPGGGDEPIARNLLFVNNGGTFTEIGETAGITHAAFGLGALFFDYNQDGFLDIYVMNHIESPSFTYDSTGVIDGYDHNCFANFLYRNNGDLTFTEVAGELGLNSAGCTIAAIPTDYDMDGDLDLYLANDFGDYLIPNELFENKYPEDRFEDVSEATGANVPAFGMGIAAGDFDHDLDIDYYVTNIGRNILIENTNGMFTDITAAAGVENTFVPGEGRTTGWGTAFIDIDNNRWLDLYVTNGRMPSLPAFPTSRFDPDKMYMNNGDKTFTDMTVDAGVGDTDYGRGMAYSDYDKDGDLDICTVVLTEQGGHSKFYVNQIDNDNHYIQFKLTGVESNRDAFGSKVWLYAGGEAYLKEIYSGGCSHASQSTTVVHFGLGDIDEIDSLHIEWPNGHVDYLGVYAVDQLHEITEGVVSSVKEEFVNALGVAVQPNPFDNHIRLSVETPLVGKLRARLFSAQGQLVLDRKLELTQSEDLLLDQPLAPGLYTLTLQTEEGMQVEKLLKM
ncbi:MAG: FG-GAP-like repeat-containing protein [Bacteroidota bacterium]